MTDKPKRVWKEIRREGLQHDKELSMGPFRTLRVARSERTPEDDAAIRAERDELMRLKRKLGLAWWQIAVLSGRTLEAVRMWKTGYRQLPDGFVAVLKEESSKHRYKFETRRRKIIERYGKGQSGIRGKRDRAAGATTDAG